MLDFTVLTISLGQLMTFTLLFSGTALLFIETGVEGSLIQLIYYSILSACASVNHVIIFAIFDSNNKE